ncbi:MAG: hypothetical protein K2N37_09640, partial [Lachnospiraceae bacterium]|nr:hypothetical protein [Lachnospiraceae bacterium]
MEKTKYEEASGVLETTEEAAEKTAEETTEEQAKVHNGKKQKKDKPKKNRVGIRTMLRILQHIALAVMAFSMLIVTVSGTVRISGVHSGGTYTNFTGYSDPGTPFEDSEAFNAIFGYAVADIIRFGVVSSQMETGEDVFDGNKIVDVTAYNYRNDVLPEQYVTAGYRLEDLLKWQSYGFSYSEVEMTEAEAEAFLADTTQITSIDKNSGYQNTTDANYLKSDVKTYTSVSDVEAGSEVNVEFAEWDEDSGFVTGYQPIGNLADHADAPKTEIVLEEKADEISIEYRDADESVYAYTVLINRYKTAEGKNLEEYVSDWTHYYELCNSVRRAAENLAYNYNEYVEYKEYFDSKNSNVRYLIEKPVGQEIQSYSNVEAGSSYREHMRQCMAKVAQEKSPELVAEKFIYYCPADMTYVTNTDIAESTVRRILQEYDYAYPEATRIWINVDTSYPAVDAFTRGAEYLPNLWQWAVAAVAAGVLYLILFIYQTVVTGRAYDENGEKYIRLNGFDEIPTEGA